MVIILHIIIDKNKLVTAKMFSKVRFTNKSGDRNGQLTPLGVIALYSQCFTMFRKS